MITINYTEKGKPISDFEIIPLVKKIIKAHNESPIDVQFDVSTNSFIYVFMYAVRDGVISYKDIKILENGLEMRLNKEGKMLDNFRADIENETFDLVMETKKFTLE